MKISLSALTKTLPILAIAGAMAALTAPPAMAQTAEKLDCKGCVKSKQLKNNGVKSKDIKDGQVRNQDLGPNAVDGSKIADGAVGTADLGTDAVTDVKIADGAVGSSEVAAESITATDLSNEPGVDFAFDTAAFISTTDSTVVLVQLTAPTDGFATVIANGTFKFGGATATATCSIVNTATFTVNLSNNLLAAGTPENDDIPFAQVRTFAQSAGTKTYRLNCDTQGGTVEMDDVNITAMFFPSRY